MKKFGTPIGAAPGTAYEYVGFDGVGTPLLVTAGGGAGGVLAFFDFDLLLGAPGCLRLLPASPAPMLSSPELWLLPLPEPLVVGVETWTVVVGVLEAPFDGLGLGVVEAEVEVDVEVEVVGAGVVVVTVAAGVVAVTGGHDWATFVIGRLTGSGSDVGSVPGGTFRNVNCWPPATVIVKVHPSADAFGNAPRPNTATMQAMVTAAMLSLRLLVTVAYSSRKVPHAHSSQLRSQVGLAGSY